MDVTATMPAAASPRVPADADGTRARALFAAGRDWEAGEVLARIHAVGTRDSELVRKLGWARFALGDTTGAEACMREALAAAPGEWESHYAFGAVLRGRDDRAAFAALKAALERAPDNVDCLLALSSCALAQRDAQSAERFARNALAVAPDRPDAWVGLGLALLTQERLQEAHDALLRAEELTSIAADCEHPNLDRGVALRLLGRTREAIEYYEAKLPEAPDAAAHGQYALALLTAGEFHRGWEQYGFRWFDASLAAQRSTHDRPQWRGEDLEGKTVLLRCEQGIGDVLQFIRYAPLMKAGGATVLLELRPGLGTLANTLPGVDAAFPHGKVARDFDCYADLMSLPGAFGTTLETIPADVPYLHVDEARTERWRERLANDLRPRIGLVWAGDPRHARDRQRSIPLDVLEPLFDVRGVAWFSLQKGSAASALKAVERDHAIADLADHLGEYADTAAAIDALDLVVTVDTSVAHLAGALGKPVWVLLPTPADWRWLEGREDSPWYPTMRLFRQRDPGDWPEVVARVATALEDLRNYPAGATGHRADGAAGEPVCVPQDRGRRDSIARACRTRVGMMQCLPAFDQAAASLEHYGEYLQAQVDLLLRLVRRDAVVVEVGAGLGYHAIALAPLAGAHGQILAIEGSRAGRIVLRQNVVVCGVAGVSVMPGNVAGMTLDALAFERADLVKVSVAACVEPLLDECVETLWRLRPMLFVARDSYEALDALAARMIDFGYRCWSADTSLFNADNFNRRDDDVFAGARSLALLAIPEERDLAPPPGIAAVIAPVTA